MGGCVRGFQEHPICGSEACAGRRGRRVSRGRIPPGLYSYPMGLVHWSCSSFAWFESRTVERQLEACETEQNPEHRQISVSNILYAYFYPFQMHGSILCFNCRK